MTMVELQYILGVLVVSIPSAFIIFSFLKFFNDGDNLTPDLLITYARALLNDDVVVNYLLNSIALMSDQPNLTGAEKKEAVINSLKSKYANLNLDWDLISQVINILATYWKLYGKLKQLPHEKYLTNS